MVFFGLDIDRLLIYLYIVLEIVELYVNINVIV